MVTMCEGKAGFALAQLVLRFCEHWHMSPEAGSAQGTFPSAWHLLGCQPPTCPPPIAPRLLTRNRSLEAPCLLILRAEDSLGRGGALFS